MSCKTYACGRCGESFLTLDTLNEHKSPIKCIKIPKSEAENKIKEFALQNLEKIKKTKKKEYGQFFTKNHSYILQNIHIPDEVETIIEPFTGEGDLLEYISSTGKEYNLKLYDIDPKKESIVKQDTLMNPPDYTGSFVITNPPYLARNKSPKKEVYDKYGLNDLYKCFLSTLITTPCQGGILIIPLNFMCSTREADQTLREVFLSVYSIEQINIFEEDVFPDTSCTVCSILFKEGKNDSIINVDIYPSKRNIQTKLSEENNYTIGGEVYNLKPSKNYKMERLCSKNLSEKNTNIVVKCIDDNSKSMIRAEYVEDDKELFVDTTPNSSARGKLTLMCTPPIDKTAQKKVVDDFNEYLNQNREKYHSLFMANYRDSSDIARKRISYTLVYRIFGHLLDKECL